LKWCFLDWANKIGKIKRKNAEKKGVTLGQEEDITLFDVSINGKRSKLGEMVIAPIWLIACCVKSAKILNDL